MLLLFVIFEWLFVIIISERVKGKTTSWSTHLILLSLWKVTHPDLVLTLKTKSGYKEAMSVPWFLAIGRSFIFLLIFTTPLALQQLSILPARFNSLHFHAGGTKDIFGGGSSTKKCDHDWDQGLVKISWGSVLSIHTLVNSCFGFIGLQVCERNMSKNTKFSSSSSC